MGNSNFLLDDLAQFELLSYGKGANKGFYYGAFLKIRKIFKNMLKLFEISLKWQFAQKHFISS